MDTNIGVNHEKHEIQEKTQSHEWTRIAVVLVFSECSVFPQGEAVYTPAIIVAVVFGGVFSRGFS